MMPVISSEKPELYQLIQNYYHDSNKILPGCYLWKQQFSCTSFFTCIGENSY